MKGRRTSRSCLTMRFTVPIMLVWLCLCQTVSSYSEYSSVRDINRKLCRELCQCTTQTIDCNRQDNLQFLPSQFPLDSGNQNYDKLHISHAHFRNLGLTRHNFSNIQHLTSLKLVYSQLQSLADNTFSLLDRLIYLDLSNNRFRKIESRAFAGLNLASFYLERNHGGLDIQEDMFQGLTVTMLFLNSNGISQLPVGPFMSMNIKMLHLFNNSITTLDRKFSRIFDLPESMIDLTQNPLECQCGFDWFQRLLRQWHNKKSYVQIKCATPLYLQDRLLENVQLQEFPCEVPQINKISVDIGPHYIRLVCHATGSNRPRLTWRQIGPPGHSELSQDLRQSPRASYVSLNVSHVRDNNSFVCSAYNEIQMSTQVHVRLNLIQSFLRHLSVPPQTILPPTGDPDLTSVISKNPNFPAETHFLFRKQFSILQMIGAVVGTFTSVVLIIIIVCCTQEHVSKKHSSPHNAYWTIMPTSHHEPKFQPHPHQFNNQPNSNNPYLLPVNQNNNPTANQMIGTSTILQMSGSTHSQEYDVPQYETSNFLNNNNPNNKAYFSNVS